MFSALPAWDGREGPRRRITIGPGVIVVGSHDPAKGERTAERQHLAHVKLMDLAGAAGDLDVLDGAGRGRILGWSAKSRARMVKTLAAVDFGPLIAAGVPAMVTLTLPGDWETVAPTAKAWQKIVQRFLSRYRRAWGHKIRGVWKREYQRRGAPHLHVLMVPPAGTVTAVIDGEQREVTFREWLGWAWSESVKHPDPEQRRRNRLAGTGIDYAAGLRAKDPRRVGEYFSKHGRFSAKSYQDLPPELWRRCEDCGALDCAEEGHAAAGSGRTWGLWDLSPATATVEVTHEDALWTARTLRRWHRAQTWRDRHGRPIKAPRRMAGSLGFLCVNDGPAMAATVARYLDLRALPAPDFDDVPITGWSDRAMRRVMAAKALRGKRSHPIAR